MNLLLVRHAYLPDVTLGKLTVGALELFTLEEPWIANPKGRGGARKGDGQESCVPDGQYVLKPHDGSQWKDVWRLSNPALGVFDYESEMPAKASWGRAAILLGHPGNTTKNILGCILTGTATGRLNDMPAVLNSQRALALLRGVLGLTDTHTLTIEPTRGTA